jgi:hypothetical protein
MKVIIYWNVARLSPVELIFDEEINAVNLFMALSQYTGTQKTLWAAADNCSYAINCMNVAYVIRKGN